MQNTKERFLGWWSEQGPKYAKCPSVKLFIDAQVAMLKKKEMLKYLTAAPIVAATSARAYPCVICGWTGTGNLNKRTDNVWTWLDNIEHYIVEHNLRLPDELVQRAEELNFIPPAAITVPLEELPGPPRPE